MFRPVFTGKSVSAAFEDIGSRMAQLAAKDPEESKRNQYQEIRRLVGSKSELKRLRKIHS